MAGPEEKDKGLKVPPELGQRTTPYGTPAPSEATAEFDLADARLAALQERYDLLAELGRGGMGAVYKARDRETGDVVGLKVILPEIAARADLIERFKSELLLARKITHKNVCRVYDLNRFGSVAAISMEYIEGESLRCLLNRVEGLSVRHALKVLRQALAGLAEAHAQGVVHRDLKPENILIARDGTVKVMDFGIARSVEVDATQTGTGTLIGTPAYMSPEQAEGKAADARSDIYSLGLIMYEMFTGRPAFRADTPVAYAVKHLHESPSPPRTLEPDLPARIDHAIGRCLEKNPSRRYQSVKQLEPELSKETSASLQLLEAPSSSVPWFRGERGMLFVLFTALFVTAAGFFLPKELFLLSLLVIAIIVGGVSTWPTLSKLSALFWAGAALVAVNWFLAVVIMWSLYPVLVTRFAKAGLDLPWLTSNALLICLFVQILFPGYPAAMLLVLIFQETERKKVIELIGSRFFGLTIVGGNLILLVLLVYSVLVVPFLMLPSG